MHPHCSVKRFLKDRKGTTIIEYALIVSLLITLTLGIMECGYMFFSWVTLTKATQMGVRLAVTGAGDEEGTRLTLIEQEVRRLSQVLEDENLDISIRSWPDETPTGEPRENNAGEPCQLVEVHIQYKYTPLTPFSLTFLPDPFYISARQRKINEPWRPCL